MGNAPGSALSQQAETSEKDPFWGLFLFYPFSKQLYLL